MAEYEKNAEIQLFRDYLRLASVQPNVNYRECLQFLDRIAGDLGLPVKIYYPMGPKKPILVMTWLGEEATLPSIMLNSHMDVVPVFEEHWTHPPFAAEMDENGRIFARGSQDMKCVGMQYLAAIRALKKDGFKPKRTFHISFDSDEEIGGFPMGAFVQTEEFKRLNVGFGLDEGIASPDASFPAYYAERTMWFIQFHIRGTPGHGSLLHKATAGEKARYIIDRMMDIRQREVEKLEKNPELTIGDVTTVNLTQMHGGVQSNVVPPLLTVVFDCRIAVDVDLVGFEQTLYKWCQEAGGDIDIEWEQKQPYRAPTKTDDSNIYWKAFKTACDELKLEIKPRVFPGATDSRYLRGVGIPAIGFSPINNTPVLLHDHDEYLGADVYLRGIDIYKQIIRNLAAV